MAALDADIEPGDPVAVWGCGPVGQFTIQSAWMLGAGRVIAIDRVPERLEMARRHGRAETIDFEEVGVYDQLMEMTGGRGPDRCIVPQRAGAGPRGRRAGAEDPRPHSPRAGAGPVRPGGGLPGRSPGGGRHRGQHRRAQRARRGAAGDPPGLRPAHPDYPAHASRLHRGACGPAGARGLSGMRALEILVARGAGVVVLTGVADVGTAVEAMREGAYTYLVKPVAPQELRVAVEGAAARAAPARAVPRGPWRGTPRCWAPRATCGRRPARSRCSPQPPTRPCSCWGKAARGRAGWHSASTR